VIKLISLSIILFYMVKIPFSKKSNLFDNNDLTKTKKKIHIPQPTIDLE